MSGRRYAADTTVPADRTRAELERVLTRYGAHGFAYAWDAHGAQVAFLVHDRHVRFQLPLPDPTDYATTPTGLQRSPSAAASAHAQAVRARWRALLLIVTAKLEAVAAGVVGFDTEFLAHLVLPGDQVTVGERVAPQVAEALAGGQPPALLPGRPG